MSNPYPQPYPQQAPPQAVKKPSGAAIFFGIMALLGGLFAFFQAGMRGHSVGWEEMAIYSIPAVICALIAIAIRRNGWTYAGLFGAVLAIVGLLLGW